MGDEDFNAKEMCCSCNGGSIPKECVANDDSYYAVDNSGDDCDWYDNYPDACGLHDNDDFVASERCCACGGGLYERVWPPANLALKAVKKEKDASYTDVAVAAFAAIASLAVFGWSVKTAFDARKRNVIQQENDVYSRLM